jgi:hypothetical protein
MAELAAPLAPNFQAFNDAVNGMTTEATNISASVQTYTQHQQIVGQQLQIITNQPQNNVLNNLVDAVAELRNELREMCTELRKEISDNFSRHNAKHITLTYLYN